MPQFRHFAKRKPTCHSYLSNIHICFFISYFFIFVFVFHIFMSQIKGLVFNIIILLMESKYARLELNWAGWKLIKKDRAWSKFIFIYGLWKSSYKSESLHSGNLSLLLVNSGKNIYIYIYTHTYLTDGWWGLCHGQKLVLQLVHIYLVVGPLSFDYTESSKSSPTFKLNPYSWTKVNY